MTGYFNPRNSAKYQGTDQFLIPFVSRNREPTGADYRQPETGRLYALGSVWQVAKNPTTGLEGDLWMLSKIVANVAYWIRGSAGSIGPLLEVEVDAATAPGVNPVTPDGLGLMTVEGSIVANQAIPIRTHTTALNQYDVEVQYATSAGSSDPDLAGMASFNSNQFSVDADGFVSLSGGGVAIDSLGVQATSGTGTNPVLPDVNGKIETQGALVAAGTNPVRSVSTAANTTQLQVQTSQALAATDSTKVGLANFDSANFSVDANGFVSLSPGISQGNYTPVIIGGTSAGVGTYISQQGSWVKIGKMCLVTTNIIWTAHTGTGDQLVTLPFTATATPTFNENVGDNPFYAIGTHNLAIFALIASSNTCKAFTDTSVSAIQIQNDNHGYVFQFMYEFV